MPEMDGFELAELMRGAERTRHVPIIFVTAGMQERHRLFKGYDAGAVDFLFKPLEPSILRHKTETFFQLHRQQQDLAETLRLNEELMAVVGHDLRNPLNVILMTTSLLAESTDPELKKYVERLQASGSRMLHIIEELFDLIACAARRRHPHRTPTDSISARDSQDRGRVRGHQPRPPHRRDS